MNLLFITPWFPDEKISSHGLFIQEQVRALSAAQHQVTVLSAKVDESRRRLFAYHLVTVLWEGYTEYRLRVAKSLPWLNQLTYFLAIAITLYRIRKKIKPNLIQGNIGYAGGMGAWLASRLFRKPYVLFEHTMITNNFRSFWHRRATLFAYRNARAVATVSRWAAERINEHVPCKVSVIPNMIDLSRFSVGEFPPPEPVHFGFLGGLDTPLHTKGLPLLLSVLATIDTPFFLHIAGAGRQMNYYISLAQSYGLQDKCKFYGQLRPQETPAFMNKLHFFVNTSTHETFGVAIAEAMASGLPVVVFDTGGAAAFVNADNGYIVPKQDKARLREALTQMMQRYKTFDRGCIRASVEQFSDTRVRQTLEAWYRRVLQEHVN